MRSSWIKALGTLILPLLLVFSARWILIEPFVIPSSSMVPTLLVNDHILVNKLSLGIRNPFSNQFLIQWSDPKRGDIVVFKYPNNPDVFFVKRLIGLPNDKVRLESGVLSINGEALSLEPSQADLVGEEGFSLFLESSKYLVRYSSQEEAFLSEYTVPENHFFMMGDNRDQSSDSRVWGSVPRENLVGKVGRVWFSCSAMLESAPFLCDLQKMRWSRLFLGVQ